MTDLDQPEVGTVEHTAPTPVVRHGKQDAVRDRIAALMESMSAGEPLPPERDLAARLGVARMTLRRAVDTLVAEGRLIRRPGAGTFIAPSLVEQRLTATSFSEDMRSRGMEPGARTVWARQVPADMMMASVLQIPTNAPVLHVRRLRTADDTPMALEDLHVPAELVPGLTGADLENASFYTLLHERFGHTILAGTQTIETHLVTEDEAAYLDVPAADAAFLFERTSRTEDGSVAEFVRSVYRGDRYRIVVDIFPTPIPGTRR